MTEVVLNRSHSDGAEQQGVSPELLSPYFEPMRRRLAEGGGEEDLTGVVDLLVR